MTALPRRRPSTVFVIKLRSWRTEADNVRALRWILKRLLRGYRLRYVSIVEERPREWPP
jgi:hypothetical protein